MLSLFRVWGKYQKLEHAMLTHIADIWTIYLPSPDISVSYFMFVFGFAISIYVMIDDHEWSLKAIKLLTNAIRYCYGVFDVFYCF